MLQQMNELLLDRENPINFNQIFHDLYGTHMICPFLLSRHWSPSLAKAWVSDPIR